ncbi:hypothetical protein N5079_25200 [Planotetraspora sp. A-T 1434]|uniref:hypothetical protein n=1 Tax=Planotetraspora sp. A-T 1434 TaxID=2979219 RepID=UPI0021BE5588|nr:hypothetical protein [Planotetraspora sp. A-T 1434]MCT9933515.1 hypothetical protein [Planotetraspora sp. A-T 1434]
MITTRTSGYDGDLPLRDQEDDGLAGEGSVGADEPEGDVAVDAVLAQDTEAVAVAVVVAGPGADLVAGGDGR